MECVNKLKIQDYVSINQLKKKIKNYLIDQGYSEFKPSIFSKGLVIVLVMVLEEIIFDCLKNITKEKTGLYCINSLILKNLLNESDKFNFVFKYLRQYNSVIKYHDSVFFNINKVMDNLEIKHGSKLMIDSESKNMINYLILNLQYDILTLSILLVKNANRKTLNNQVLELSNSFILSHELNSKIKLKLDSYNIINEIEEEEDGEEDGEEDEVEDENKVEDEDEEEDKNQEKTIEIKVESKENDDVNQQETIEIKVESMIELKNDKVEKEIQKNKKKINNNLNKKK